MRDLYEGSLSDFIRHRREDLAMTQPQLAALINVSADYIAGLETGERQLDHDRIDSLADALIVERTCFCLLVALEGTSPIARKYFWGPLLAEMAEGGEA